MNSYIKSSLWLWLGLSACQAADNSERSHWEDADAERVTGKPDAPIDSDDLSPQAEEYKEIYADEVETVSPPVPVSGIFLSASLQEEGQDYLLIGLRAFVEGQRVRELPESRAVSWTVSASAENTLSSQVEKTKDPNFDAYFILKGASAENLKAALGIFDVRLQVSDTTAAKVSESRSFNLAEILNSSL